MANYYLGLDVSKGYSDFVMLNQSKKSVDKHFQLDDTATGHRQLEQYLCTFFQLHPEAKLFAAVESTGGYENNWYHRLCQLSESYPLQVARLNPARVKANSRAGAKHNKTDQISANDVAEYLLSHPDKVNYQKTTDSRYPMLRRQWNFIRLNTKIKTQLLTHLESLLYTAMPELLSLCRHGVPTWLLRILSQFSTYDALRSAGVKRLARLPYVSPAKAERLLKLLQQGIGESSALSGQIIATLAKQILELEQLIELHKKLLERHYQEAEPEVDLLRSCTGIGVYSAVGLLLNLPNGVVAFASAKKLSSYWGVHPVYKESGDGSWGYHMSKNGRIEPRAILYMVTYSAIQHNPVIKELYARCMTKGMTPKAALGVCMHKITRIVYGMLKHHRAFDPQINRNHQIKHQVTHSQSKNLNKKRRLQPFDHNAPISSRQHKKRKKQTQSQDEYLVQCGILEPALPSYT